MDSEGVIPEGLFGGLQTVLAKLEFFSVEHDSVFCTMKEKIEGVKECPFDVRVIE